MKKIILITIVLVLAGAIINIVRMKDKRTTYSGLKTALDMAMLKTYRDSVFGYTVKYPSFFQQEKADSLPVRSLTYARFAFRRDVNVVLETYVLMNEDNGEGKEPHVAGFGKGSEGKDGVVTEPVYENGVRIDGYSRHAKYIRSGKIVFVCSLTYPDSYKPVLTRLFNLVDEWEVLGAVN